MTSLLKKYNEEIIPKLKEEFSITNALALPRVEKVVINVGAAEALTEKSALEKIKEQLEIISGQKPKITKAKKSISTFKLKQGDAIGATVTLRSKKAWDFLDKFVNIVVPRIRDFRGLDLSKFDSHGNYNLGLLEQSIFPYLEYSKIDKARGLVVTITIKNGSPEKSKILFELIGLPFKK